VIPKRLRSLEVDDQIVLGRRLHWQIARFLALEGSIDVAGRAAGLVIHIISLGDEALVGT
jgi:hypothetical protein